MTSADATRPRVAVGVDGSAGSIAALRWAARYAEATGGVVRAVMAWHYPAAVGLPVGRAPAQVTDEVKHDIRGRLDRVVAEAFPGTPPGYLEPEVSYGHPAQVLVDESEQADLMVVGRRGHSPLAHLRVGSVSSYLISHAACPVTLVPSDQPG
jgi:nucleotide-binding universal stress UspA family protein